MTTTMPVLLSRAVPASAQLAALKVRSISVWFGERKMLHRVSLVMSAGL